MQLIPVTNDARQTFTTVLNGQEIRITMWYQTIGGGWYISLAFVNGTSITNGARLNCSNNVMRSVLSDFVGGIVPVPAAVETSVIGRNGWNATHTLNYFTPDELVQAGLN